MYEIYKTNMILNTKYSESTVNIEKIALQILNT